MYGSLSQVASLPIPRSLRATRTSTAPNISYPESANSDLFSLAGGTTTYFGLRFTGELPPPCCAISIIAEKRLPLAQVS